MKWIVKNYRGISIWLSLFIVSLGFAVGSDHALRRTCVPLAFFAGALMYLSGGIREWANNRMPTALLEILLSFCMLGGLALSLIRQGGFL